ncbi:MAG TPA: ABC transporter permease subunit [Vicinamibacteria bacterium]|nr:ABC transporter permease subunit [Vicinamibacteria bacterium]
MRLRQTWEVMRLELRRSLTFWPTLCLLFLAFAPTAIITGHMLDDNVMRCRLQQESIILAGIFQAYYVRFAVFFGCLWIFMRLVRGEMAERTLHYLFLAPVRRDVLVLGKFLSGTALATVIFCAGVLSSFVLMYAHFPAGQVFVRHGGGLAHLGAYLLATALACLGYGAVFLGLSLVFRNPIVPAAIVLVWEGINGALPVWLKRFSVTYYLKPLFPVELPVEGFSGLFTVVAEPIAPWVAVLGLVLFAALVLAFACWRIRSLEISYATD